MSSVAGIQRGLCLLRHGSHPREPIVFFCRHSHRIAHLRFKNIGKLSSCGLSTVANQKQLKPFTIDLPDDEIRIIESCKPNERFITDSGLVKNILYCLDPWNQRSSQLIVECNPGPGVLSRALLETGCTVAALEKNSKFLPGLKKLKESTSGQLRVLHCDFFSLDPWADGILEAPKMHSSALMEQLGYSQMPWDTEIPLRVFGILDPKKERILLWRYIYNLFECLSIFRYGRIELNFFMSERQYKCLIAKPGDFHYQASTVLCRLAFDVDLMLKEHNSTFFTSKKVKCPSRVKSGSTDDHLCLVSITPRRNLFCDRFQPSHGRMFINMVRYCLVKPSRKLLTTLDSWCPGEGEQLLECLKLPADIKARELYPEEYKLLFEMLTQSEDFDQGILFNEIYDDQQSSYMHLRR